MLQNSTQLNVGVTHLDPRKLMMKHSVECPSAERQTTACNVIHSLAPIFENSMWGVYWKTIQVLCYYVS